MSTIVETIQAIVRQELARVRVADLGVVEAVGPHRAQGDGDNYGCDVRLKNSGLLLKRVPIATQHIGSAAIPNAGDLVLLTYDKGDVNQPIVIGRLYSDADRPPLNDSREIVTRLPLAEADDRTIRTVVRNVPASSPPREALLEMPPRITLRVTDGTVRATAGNTEMKLDQQGAGGGTVTVFAGRSTVTINQDGDVTVDAAGGLALKAAGAVSIQGRSVSIKALTSATVEAGTTLTAKGGATATLQAGATATVQGAVVSVKGITSFGP
ncbi:MAG TPA: phage baseplate assembly protein V [Longimicrobiaceae bacterium]|jgi:phage baseplate assembly protein gpV|nr:phage baseplate assembly protein V [Longimicrobiaceae bacterium]